jgi:hypothetical protein
MTRRTTRGRSARVAFATFGIIFVVMPEVPASADPPALFGWWTTENPGLPQESIPTLVPGQSSGIPGDPSPDIPSGGFEVTQIGADTSYAAIGYFTYGSSVSTVALKLAGSSANISDSKVEACQLTGNGSFTTEQAGPLSDGPAYSCTNSVQGVEDISKGIVTFQVGKFVENGYLGVAIVASGPGRLVFDAPDSSTIQTQPMSASSSTSPTSLSVDQSPSATPSGAVPAQAASTGSISTQTPTFPTTNQNAVSPVPAGSSIAKTPTRPSIPSTFVAVSTPSPTIGIGNAAVGAVLVVVVALGVSAQSRRRIRRVVLEAESE